MFFYFLTIDNMLAKHTITEKYIPGAIKDGSFVYLKALTLNIRELMLKTMIVIHDHVIIG
jgi:hypothetical protein